MLSNIFKFVLLLLIVTGGYTFADVSDYGADLKSKLESKYDKYTSEDYFDKMQKTTQLGNMYDQAYEMAQTMQFAADKQSLDYIKSYLTSKGGNCSISDNDIYLVFGNSLDGKIISYDAYFANKGKTQQKTNRTQAESFVDACRKVFRCMGQQIPEDETAYSSDTYTRCMSTITSLHSTLKPTISQANEFKTLNYGDEMFANGSLEDSSYDVLVDIENIGKVFFRDNKQPNKITFYNANSNSSRNAPRRLQNNQSLFDQFTNGNRNLGSTSNYTTKNYDNIAKSIIYNSSAPNSSNTAQTSSSLSNQQIGNSSIISDGESIINSTCVNGCLPNQKTLVTDANSNDDSSETNGPKTNTNTYDTSSINIPKFTGNKLGNGAITDIREALFGENGGESGVDQAAMNSCMSRCEGLSFVDRAVCQSRCSCGGGSSQDDIYKISICLEKTKTRGIAGSKAVMSIEEIIDEIDNTFRKMRESGALMPHRKPTEMLETALQMIDLGSIFSFTAVIDKKPVFGSDKTEQDKKKEADEQKKINKSYEEGILGFYEPNTKAGRNRYLVMFNPETSQPLRGPGKSPSVAQTRQNMDLAASSQKQNDATNLPKDKEKKINTELFKSVSDFIDYNGEFWNAIHTQMKDLNGVARSMKGKAN